MAILQQIHWAKIMVLRHKLLLFHYNRLTLMGILTCSMTWFQGLFPLRFLTMTLNLIHHCVNILGLVIVLQNSVSQSILCLNLNRHCLVSIHALPRNYFIPFVITDNFHHLLMKFHSYVRTQFCIPNDKN